MVAGNAITNDFNVRNTVNVLDILITKPFPGLFMNLCSKIKQHMEWDSFQLTDTLNILRRVRLNSI